jgi:signal transduction histidine kinase
MNSNQAQGIKGNILIVDDTPDNLRLLSSMLSEQGYKVRSAINGQMALMGVKASLPDLILLDINMPHMNGYEVCSSLKAMDATCEIPVIFISALGEVWDKVKAFGVGGVDYITKPFQIEEVLARIETHITLCRLQKQLTEQNRRLQQEVSDRLQAEEAERQKSQQLEQTLQQLKLAQSQLVQSEKMSSLGSLVAGIAHEINNPVSFIYGNLNHATTHTQDLLELLQLYQQALPNPPKELQEKIKYTDVEFVKWDLPKLMDSMKVGAKRISDIVQSLRSFSRHDEAELKTVDIHEGLDSTLTILQHRLAPNSDTPAIEVIREYSSIPHVECYARQINQVFMNILINAVEALSGSFVIDTESLTNDKRQRIIPTITIRTKLVNDHQVLIEIADNGLGMTEAVQTRVFEPFFTTKQLGEGAGLGMSMSYGIIVNQHSGQIRCSSAPWQGTTVAIAIPIQQAVKRQ